MTPPPAHLTQSSTGYEYIYWKQYAANNVAYMDAFLVKPENPQLRSRVFQSHIPTVLGI